MQASQAAALRRNWKGDTCDHPRLVQEYDQGKPTGDRVCTTCGKTFSHTEADSWKRQERGQAD